MDESEKTGEVGSTSIEPNGPRKRPEPEKIERKQPVEVTDTNDEYEIALARKSQRGNELMRSYMVVALCLMTSYLLGQMGFSVAWVVLLLMFLAAVWMSNFNRLIDESIAFERLRLHRKRALKSEETVEWLNFLINRWWTFSAPSIFNLVKTSLDPLLSDSKPSFLESIEIEEFNLGDSTPYINSIKAYDVTSGTKRELNYGNVLPNALKCQLNLEMNVGLQSPDFRMLLASRLGGKGVGMDLDVAIEKLNIEGKLSLTLHLNNESTFPHVTKATISFVEKPEVWFNLRILKTVQMMEVPILKTWVHSLVMDALTTALVDPGKLDVDICPMDGYVPSRCLSNSLAQGVLTITLSRLQQNKVFGALNEEDRWCVIHLGEQKQVTSRFSSSSRWQECRTFLVENITDDKLNIKMKTKRLISTITLAQFEVPLSSYSFEGNRVVETILQKSKTLTSNPGLNLRMEYTPLTPIDNDELSIETNGQVAGVMYVCIHGADDLVASDKQGGPNPYCIIFCNRKKVKTSHYVCKSCNPKWESSVEFLVADYLQMVISFAICNWDTNKMADSDLLGIGSLAMIQDEPVVLRRQIPLTFNVPTNQTENNEFGNVTISAVFRPVASVAESDDAQLQSPIWTGDDEDNFNFKAKKGANFMQTAKMFLSNKDDDGRGLDFGDIFSTGSGLMELTIIGARDLVAKDLNGFSDPYCEVKINNDCVFKTSFKKKTLNPKWDEMATLQLPKNEDNLTVIVWDRDPLGMKDFLGSVCLSLEEIRQISSNNKSEYFVLRDTKSGEIELKIKVISEDFELQENLTSDCNNETLKSFVMSPPTNVPSHGTTSVAKPLSSAVAPGRKLPMPVPSPVPPRRPSNAGLSEASAAEDKSPSVSSISADAAKGETEDDTASSLSILSSTCSISSKLPTRVDVIDKSEKSITTQQLSPTDTNIVKNSKSTNVRSTPEYSSIRAMKHKMKLGLAHPLRRFRSEASVHEPKAKSIRDRVTVETRDSSINSDFDSLVQATSHPDISKLVHSPDDKKDLSPNKEAKNRFFNVQGRIIQGLGFQASQHLIYVRIRIYRNFEKISRSSSGKTICKSALVPASINPRFDTDFQLDSSSGTLKTSALVIDIRTDKKETIATKTLVLNQLFLETTAQTQDITDWFVFSNGAKFEIQISHGKAIEKKQSRLFRSWSVHRIGKI